SDTLMLADQTPFAKDHAFGYSTAFLPAWVEERSGGRWRASDVATLDLGLIRAGGPDAVAERLQQASGGQPIVVNAASYGDLAVVALGVLWAEAAGKRFIYRTAADFVRLRSGLPRRPLLTAAEIIGDTSATGGLVVVGSYVPGSSAQLERLLALPGIAAVELPVARLLHDNAEMISRTVGEEIEAALQHGQTVVLYTSRALATGATAAESLQIGRLVSQSLIGALGQISTRPRFIIAKGGITSHDVAQRALGAQQARALGQLLPGVPVWRLEQGPNLRFPDVPYVVFPGNVGGPESLAEAVRILSG
ncbi:MAG TPA: nucleotide-binding domain containing protein, partial [Roseiflexaceae bacterium]|nr:nucleotide-binding domain containing protein [Roseiflexaceae bacterium]